MNRNKIRLYQPAPGLPSTSGGASGDVSFVRSNPTLVAVGGVPVGTTFDADTTLQDVLDAVFYPYQVPAFTSFYINGQSQTMELGASISAGNKLFLWTLVNDSNIASPFTIYDYDRVPSPAVVGTQSLGNISATRNQTVAVSKSANGATHRWQIVATNSRGIDLTAFFTVTWRPRRFAGTIPAGSRTELLSAFTASALAAVTGITITTNDLTYSKVGAANYNCAGSKYVFWLYPAALGTSTFTSNGLAGAVDYIGQINFTNAFGVTVPMHLYISTNVFNGTAVQFTQL